LLAAILGEPSFVIIAHGVLFFYPFLESLNGFVIQIVLRGKTGLFPLNRGWNHPAQREVVFHTSKIRKYFEVLWIPDQ
jgi:hypothetical protein